MRKKILALSLRNVRKHYSIHKTKKKHNYAIPNYVLYSIIFFQFILLIILLIIILTKIQENSFLLEEYNFLLKKYILLEENNFNKLFFDSCNAANHSKEVLPESPIDKDIVLLICYVITFIIMPLYTTQNFEFINQLLSAVAKNNI